MKYKADIVNGSYLITNDILMDFPCEIHFTRMGERDHAFFGYYNDVNIPIRFRNNDTFKVFVNCNEPRCSVNRDNIETVIKNSYRYDLILTTDSIILDKCKNARFFPYGTTWLNKNKNEHKDSLGVFTSDISEKVKNKDFSISFLTSGLIGVEGYYIRSVIWNNRDLIKKKTIFYSSTRTHTTNITNDIKFSETLHDGLLPNDDKINIFRSKFSIAIESNKEKSYFTEKLIDCFLTKTVPIYWGCPNISEFFDTRGMIIFDTIEEFYEKINNINESDYDAMKPYIESNFITAQKYAESFSVRIKDKILEYIDETSISEDDEVLWTIGILSLPQRKQKLTNLLDVITKSTPISNMKNVEIIVNVDSGLKTVGLKRNEILDCAKGKYISYIDDDDLVSIDYITKILDKLKTNLYDGIGFYGMYYVSGQQTMIFNHANRNNGNYKEMEIQYRPLNHLNPVRTDIARKIRFPEKNYGEDSDYSDRLLESKLITDEYVFDDIMYHYLFDPNTTETQNNKPKIYAEKNAYDTISRDIENNFHNYIKLKPEQVKTIVIVGGYHCWEARHYLTKYPNSCIHIFEPVDDYFNILLMSYGKEPRCKLHKLALTNTKGDIDFYRTSSPGSDSIYPVIENNNSGYSFNSTQKITVKSDRLREIISEEIDLLSIDVQGAEHEVLLGTDLNKVKCIFAEIQMTENKKNAVYNGQCFSEDLEKILNPKFKLHSLGLDNEMKNGTGNSFWVKKDL
jgi:FkbM family methyltransferase